MDYSEVLQHYLDKSGMTQADLARRLGTSRSSIGELMSGRSKAPSIYKAKAIADAFGVPLQEMVDMLFSDSDASREQTAD